MYKSRAKAWVEALRSGEYPQTHGVLCRLNSEGKPEGTTIDGKPGGFCCLGVLCELAIADGAPVNVEGYSDGARTYDGENGALPLSVRMWAGLGDHANPVISPEPPEPCNVMGCAGNHLPTSPGLNAAQANDSRKYTFPKIADLIEETFLKK